MRYLLTDAQMEHFVVNGFVQVRSSLPASVHEAAHEHTKRAFRGISNTETDRLLNPLNNILPMVPELDDVLHDPVVEGALTSLFGPNYLIHPHRHCHPNFPVGEPRERTTIMAVHKDGHADGNPKPRHRVPRWGLLFYNPHACPAELGPTCITPQSHIYHRLTTGGERERLVPVKPKGDRLELPENYVNRTFVPVTGDLGTVSILHFDMVHSVITNIGDMDRYAHKFVIMRTGDPDGPSWNGGAGPWSEAVPAEARNHSGYWRFLWNWLRGAADRHDGLPSPTRDVTELIRALHSGDAQARLAATDELGLHREDAESAIDSLIEALADDDDALRINACYALGAIGEPAVERLLDTARGESDFFETQPILNVSEAIHALVAVGPPARAALLAELSGPAAHMRAWAAYALGEIGGTDGPESEKIVDALIEATRDSEAPVCKHAMSALGIVGRRAGSDAAEEALRDLLSNEDSDKRVYAVQGLIRLNASSAATIAALTASLHDPHPYVAAFAHELLYRVGGEDARTALVDYLRRLRWFPHLPRRSA